MTEDESLLPPKPANEFSPVSRADQHYEVVQAPPLTGFFASEELFVEGEGKRYRKPIAAIHSIPAKLDADLSLSMRKLLEALPMAVQLDLRSRNKNDAQEWIRKIREDRATPLIEIRTRELCRLAGLSVTNLDRIHSALAELVSFSFIWNVLREDGEVEYEAIAPLIIRRDKGVGPRLGYTRFAFEPEVLLWYLEPKMWASLSWSVLTGFGRKNLPGEEAAFGLYQNLWRYVDVGRTPAFDVALLITLVLGRSRFVREVNGVREVVDYKDFKRRHLQPGLALLNSHEALNHTVEMTEVKSGRKVIRLKFIFKEKVQSSFSFQLGWPPEAISQLELLGFSQKDINTLSEVHVYTHVAEALKRLPEAEARLTAAGKTIHSRQAFFKGILENVAKGEAQTAANEARALEEAEAQHKREQARRRQESLREQFAAHQKKRIETKMRQLGTQDLQTLIQAHLKEQPSDKILYKEDPYTKPYLAVFSRWLIRTRTDLLDDWLPDPEDRDFEAWLAQQLMTVQAGSS